MYIEQNRNSITGTVSDFLVFLIAQSERTYQALCMLWKQDIFSFFYGKV